MTLSSYDRLRGTGERLSQASRARICTGLNLQKSRMYEFMTGVSKEQQRAVNDEKGHEFIRGTSGLGEHLVFIRIRITKPRVYPSNVRERDEWFDRKIYR